jgi:hypothetical protein
MLLCKLPRVISAANSEFTEQLTIASVSSYSGLPQRNVSSTNPQLELLLRRPTATFSTQPKLLVCAARRLEFCPRVLSQYESALLFDLACVLAIERRTLWLRWWPDRSTSVCMASRCSRCYVVDSCRCWPEVRGMRWRDSTARRRTRSSASELSIARQAKQSARRSDRPIPIRASTCATSHLNTGSGSVARPSTQSSSSSVTWRVSKEERSAIAYTT